MTKPLCRRTSLLLFVIFASASTCVCAQGKQNATLKVFVLAGQSNMQGQGVVDLDHPQHYNGGKGTLVWSMANSESRQQMKHLQDSAGNWVIRDDVVVRYQTKQTLKHGGLTIGFTGYEGQHHIGPELQFGHVVGDQFDDPVLLIKTCWGGKSLFKDFRPPSAGGETGKYFKQMISEIDDALSSLQTDFPQLEFDDYELTGFVWMQGWNDMVSEEARGEYANNLLHLAKDVRQALKSPGLPIVVGELGNDGEAKPGSGMRLFRDAQKQGTSRIKHARFVITHPFARPANMSPNVGHGHHWYGNAESYFLIGDALGRAMVDLLSN